MPSSSESSNQNVINILKDVKKSIDRNHIAVIQIVESCKNCREDVRSLKNSIIGNNGDGLKTAVAVHAEQIEVIQGEQQRAAAWSRKTITAVITCMLGLLGAAAMMIKDQFRGR